jgi:hypothetical protein
MASAAFAVMKPDARPISLTSPMPLTVDSASAYAALIAPAASPTAVSNPKV